MKSVIASFFFLICLSSKLLYATPRLGDLNVGVIKGDPQKISRPCFCQFGYGQTLGGIPFFKLTQLIRPGKYGRHSYGKPSLNEQNGQLYTCKGGFIDFSHMRAAMDWTAHIAIELSHYVKALENGKMPHGIIQFTPDGAELSIQFHEKSRNLNDDQILAIAQRIAYERLTWHEIASWYRWRSLPIIGGYTERVSTFSPEDSYSNLLGTFVAVDALKRIMKSGGVLPFGLAADQAIEAAIENLVPVKSRRHTRDAFDEVEGKWWSQSIPWPSATAVFKRSLDITKTVNPWRVPNDLRFGCNSSDVKVLVVPEYDSLGNSLSDFYSFKIHFETLIPQLPHEFYSYQLIDVIGKLKPELEAMLGLGFDVQ